MKECYIRTSALLPGVSRFLLGGFWGFSLSVLLILSFWLQTFIPTNSFKERSYPPYLCCEAPDSSRTFQHQSRQPPRLLLILSKNVRIRKRGTKCTVLTFKKDVQEKSILSADRAGSKGG